MAGREIHRSGITRHCDKSLVLEGYVFGLDVTVNSEKAEGMMGVAFAVAPTVLELNLASVYARHMMMIRVSTHMINEFLAGLGFR